MTLTAQAVARNIAQGPVELAGFESHLYIDLVTGAAGGEWAEDPVTGAAGWVWKTSEGRLAKVGIVSGLHNEGEENYTEEELDEGVSGIVRARLAMFRPAAA